MGPCSVAKLCTYGIKGPLSKARPHLTVRMLIAPWLYLWNPLNSWGHLCRGIPKISLWVEFAWAAFLVLVLHHLLWHHPGNQTPLLLQEPKLEWNLSFPDQWRKEGGNGVTSFDAVWRSSSFPPSSKPPRSPLTWKTCPAKHLSAGMKLKRARREASACTHISSPVSLPVRPCPPSPSPPICQHHHLKLNYRPGVAQTGAGDD